MADKSFRALFAEVRRRDDFWVEKAKLQFAEELFQLMERRGINKTELAALIGSSAAYVTKALRGDTNFTIESMVKLARAVNGRIAVHVMAEEDKDIHFRCIGRQTHDFAAPAAGPGFNRITMDDVEGDAALEVA